MADEHNRKQGGKKEEKPAREMTDQRFIEIAGKFIDVANRQNKTVSATDLHMIFLYAAARYNAHVAKNVLAVEEHEGFVSEMMKAYQEMLRNHLADPSL